MAMPKMPQKKTRSQGKPPAAPEGLKPIETCPNGHRYNAVKYGEICAVCGERLNSKTEEKSPEELEELLQLQEKDRVCGWLVCVSGVNEGRDYQIRDGKNFVGRDSDMEIQIEGDREIDRKNHAVLLYDAKARATFLLPGDSRGMVYHESTAVFEPTELEPFCHIELGESKFVYAPFCGGNFNWDDRGEGSKKGGE